MGFMDNVKSFWHSVVTDDHYALYGSPYSNSTAGGSLDASTTRLHELNNSLTHSLASSRNGSSTNIGYRPGMRSATNLNQNTEMQTFANGQPPLPSIDSLWSRIEAFLEEEYPELEDNLNAGASSADLNEFEKDLAVGPLPVEFRQFYKIHDGQLRGGKPTGLLMGLTLLDMESIAEEYALWAKVAERVEKQYMTLQHQQQQLQSTEALSAASQALRSRLSNNYLMHQKSVPPHAVQSYYIHRGWVPIARDLYGNLLGLDMAPGPAGCVGQIILYGRDFDTKIVVASSFQELVFQFVCDLEAGNFQIDKSETANDNGFLDSSRDDDYMVGDEDEDNGELSFYDRTGAEFGKSNQGKFTYIEVLKRRALKRHGITNVDSFQTAFTPQRLARKKLPETSTPRALTPAESELLKETLIDDTIKKDKDVTDGAKADSEQTAATENTKVADVPLVETITDAEQAKTEPIPETATEDVSGAPEQALEPAENAEPAEQKAEEIAL